MADLDARPRDAEIFNIKSIVSAPLIIEGRGIGIVNVYNRLGDGKFTRNDSIFLSSLADHAAIALETSNLMTSLNQRVRSQLALLDIALSMQRQIEIGGTYEYVADKLREVVWYDSITFYRIDHDQGMLVPVHSRGSYSDQVMSETFPVGEGITGHVAKTGKAELVNSATTDPRASLVSGTPEEQEAIIAVPLRGRERLIGVLTIYREGGRTFAPADFEIVQLFANQASVAVENSEVVFVGYGISEWLNAPQDGGNAGGIELSRWYGLRYVSEATAQLNTMMQDQSMLVGSSNPAQGYNGTCNGDSGGPNFYVDSEGRKIQVGVTSSGDKRCRATSIISRLDIPQAQDFIDCAVDARTDAEYAACGCTTLNNVGVCD